GRTPDRSKPAARRRIGQDPCGRAVDRLQRDPHRAEDRGGRADGLGRDPDGGDALLDRPDRVVRGVLLRPRGRQARRRRASLRPREDREPRGGDRGDADPRRVGRDHLCSRAQPRQRAGGALARHRHRRDRHLDRREHRRVERDHAARATDRFAGAGGRRRAPAHRRGDLGRRPAGARPRPGHRRHVAGSGHRARRRGGDRLRRRAAAGTRLAHPRRRGAAAAGARWSARGDRLLRAAGRRGLPQAPRAPRGFAALRRPARAVHLGHDARGRPRDGARPAGRDPRAPARRRRADPPRAGGKRAPGDRDQPAL
ncbi:MAG: Cobalt-zinc-cadmium resistance protein, partial [uncultured Solirubrobacteraceae bacterium]